MSFVISMLQYELVNIKLNNFCLRSGGGGAPVAILSWVCKVKSTL